MSYRTRSANANALQSGEIFLIYKLAAHQVTLVLQIGLECNLSKRLENN